MIRKNLKKAREQKSQLHLYLAELGICMLEQLYKTEKKSELAILAEQGGQKEKESYGCDH